jgi:DNA mismatch repair ATPase MutS
MGDVMVRLDELLHDKGAGMMMLDQVRHPCVEVVDGMSFVVNKLSFKKGKTVCECW